MPLPEHPGNEQGWRSGRKNGETARQCTAWVRSEQRRCQRECGTGLNVCDSHGGGAPAAREAGLRRVEEAKAEAKALKLVERYKAELDPDADFVTQYRHLLSTSLAWVDICQQQLEQLTRVDYETKAGDRKLDARINLWERALDRAEKFLNNAQHLNLEERNTRVRETQIIALGTLWRTWSQDLLHHIAHRIAHHDDATAIMADITTDAETLAKQHLNAKT